MVEWVLLTCCGMCLEGSARRVVFVCYGAFKGCLPRWILFFLSVLVMNLSKREILSWASSDVTGQ